MILSKVHHFFLSTMIILPFLLASQVALTSSDEKVERETLFGWFNRLDSENNLEASSSSSFGIMGLCVVGCTPYVDVRNDNNFGMKKYRKLLQDMAEHCDVLVHVGDTKPGSMPCNRTVMTKSVHMLREAALRHNKMALYTVGDNEVNDCHRFASKERNPIAADFYTAREARDYLVEDLQLSESFDLTGQFPVENHNELSNQPLYDSTDEKFRCNFDKYVELNNFAVATLEVVGSHYYLDDERLDNYPKQDEVDPLQDRLQLFLNANQCALDWIPRSAAKASSSGKRAVFFLLHALIYGDDGSQPKSNHGIGDFYSTDNLANQTETLTGTPIMTAYRPIFDKLTETAFAHPNLIFYIVHADGHRFSTMRINPYIDNKKGDIRSHHNLMAHMVEGSSRSLTMYSRFTVDSYAFQPVTVKEEWSRSAFEEQPVGHIWASYP